MGGYSPVAAIAELFEISRSTGKNRYYAACGKGGQGRKRGTVFVVWDHKFIQRIFEMLGVDGPPGWKESDFDSIWVVTIDKGRVSFVEDREGLTPAATCNF
jgi:hypothetical protein